MPALKQLPEPIDIEHQIENLKEIGLIVDDEEYARKILNDISYFRLVKAFSLKLKPKNGRYNENVRFENIVDLYLFNANLRQLLFPIIERVEVNLRCRISNYFCVKYGALGYKDSANFVNEDYHKEFIDDIADEIRRNSRAPFVKNFRENYISGELPLYALVEVLSFGTLSKLFKNMKNADKKIISKQFGVGYTYFESWIENISYVRNICAHYGRLYDAKLTKTPRLYDQYTKEGIGNNRIFATILCLKNIVNDSEHWIVFVNELVKLVDKYKGVDVTTMGFPNDWKSYLLIEEQK